MKLSKGHVLNRLMPIFTVCSFALYPIFALYALNADQLLLKQFLLPVIFSLVLSAIVFVIWLSILRDSYKSALATVLFLLLFWNYTLIFAGITKIISMKHWHSIPLFLVIYFHLVYFINLIKNPRTLRNLNTILLAPILLLLLFNIVTITRMEIIKFNRLQNREAGDKNVKKLIPGKFYPDIFVIILDEYASVKTIRDEWGYDNSAFSSFLKNKGFFVADNSEGRYNQTTWNLASFLNLDYITGPVDKNTFMNFVYDQKSVKDDAAYPMLSKYDFNAQILKMSDNLLIKFMHDIGYKTLVLEGFSRFYSQYVIKDSDFKFSYQDINKTSRYSFLIDAFNIELMRQSLIFPFDLFFKIDQASDLSYDGTRYVFDFLKNGVNEYENPKFVYAHILCPHSPIVFDRNGKFIFPITPNDQREGSFVKKENTVNAAYLEQYIYVTDEVKKIVDAQVKSNGSQDPVVVILSDHGPRPHELYLKDKLQSFKVFNAVYFPDRDYAKLNDSIAPINLMRVILNKYVDGNYKMLEER